MNEVLLPILAKLEWIHESCDPEYKKQKENAYYDQWRKSIVFSDLWFAIHKGYAMGRNELIIMMYDNRFDEMRKLRDLKKDLEFARDEYAKNKKAFSALSAWDRESYHYFNSAEEDCKFLTRKVEEAERDLNRRYRNSEINISSVKIDLGENGYHLRAPYQKGVYNSCQREKFYSVEDVFRHFYDNHVKNEKS